MAIKREDVIDGVRLNSDTNVQVMLDSRVLMTLCQWLDEREQIRYFSDIVKEGVYLLVETLIDNGETRLVEDTNESKYFLEYRFGVNLNRGGKGKRNLLSNMVISDRNKVHRQRMIDSFDPRMVEIEMEKLKRQQTLPGPSKGLTKFDNMKLMGIESEEEYDRIVEENKIKIADQSERKRKEIEEDERRLKLRELNDKKEAYKMRQLAKKELKGELCEEYEGLLPDDIRPKSEEELLELEKKQLEKEELERIKNKLMMYPPPATAVE